MLMVKILINRPININVDRGIGKKFDVKAWSFQCEMNSQLQIKYFFVNQILKSKLIKLGNFLCNLL
jgi:hypothetical protein